MGLFDKIKKGLQKTSDQPLARRGVRGVCYDR